MAGFGRFKDTSDSYLLLSDDYLTIEEEFLFMFSCKGTSMFIIPFY